MLSGSDDLLFSPLDMLQILNNESKLLSPFLRAFPYLQNILISPKQYSVWQEDDDLHFGATDKVMSRAKLGIARLHSLHSRFYKRHRELQASSIQSKTKHPSFTLSYGMYPRQSMQLLPSDPHDRRRNANSPRRRQRPKQHQSAAPSSRRRTILPPKRKQKSKKHTTSSRTRAMKASS